MKMGKMIFCKKSKVAKRIIASVMLFSLFVGTLPMGAFAATTTYQYKVVPVKKLGRVLSSSYFASVEGTPGITISITKTQSVARSYSCTLNVSIKEINTALGWSKSTTDQVSVSNGGSWKVPSKYKNKSVTRGVLRGYVYMDRYEYKIMRRTMTIGSGGRGKTVSYGKWEDWKTGCIAYKARTNDIYYKASYIYK